MNGVICIDKPSGMTSFDVVAIVRSLTNERKVGHAGTLDPMATGVLPIFLGGATKAIPLLLNHDKRYAAGLRLGIKTDTGDITGKVLATSEVSATPEQVEAAVLSFKGNIKQIPPMYSALKSGGRHLYDIAREGGYVERKPRDITIYDIGVTGRDESSGDYLIDVYCSKGTYIRTLCEDIGDKLGCGGTMSSLRRTYAAGFDLTSCITLDEAERLAEEDKLDTVILNVEELFKELPEIHITKNQAVRFRNGGALSFDRLHGAPQSGLCRVKYADIFLGLGESNKEKRQINVKCHFNREIPLNSGEVI
ncbi:tRNA pseudouridine synthase B [[Clostridium] cellulosi]|jgi:tRNA pseudouridine 55 synthase|uniref:tRNA pseudouridine synthase B n=1 Tax=[Clostridium] cellulosi TaxID=29343 RepID=A0A078KMY7_9FIRM|nr:tRNA pseudouridine synthase B [[Clostridium] cellulosi]